MLLWSFWNAQAKSVKVFLYYFLPEPLHDCIPKQQVSTKAMTAFIVSSAHFEAQVIYNMWNLLYSVASTFLWYLVSGSLSGSDDSVLFDYGGNGAYSQMFYVTF